MHKRLARHVNTLMIIGTTIGHENSYYRGKLLDITPETFEVELYSKDGLPEGRLMGPTVAITSIQLDNRELRELTLQLLYDQSASIATELVAIPPVGA